MPTRKIVPREDNEGGLGTALKRWASAFIAAITCTTINALTLAAASVGFTIAGGTTSKTLTVDETVAISGKATISYGDWTPTLTPGTSGTITLHNIYKTGCWARIGNMVFLSGFFVVQSVSSPVGALTLGGFPFTVANAGKYLGSVSVFFDTLITSATDPHLQGRLELNAKTAVISKLVAGSTANLAQDIKTDTQLAVSINYITSE